MGLLRSRSAESASSRIEISPHQKKELAKKGVQFRRDIAQVANEMQKELTNNFGLSLDPVEQLSRERFSREIGFLLWLGHFLFPELNERPLLPLIGQNNKGGDAWLHFIGRDNNVSVLPQITFQAETVREWLPYFSQPDSIDELKARVQIYQLVGQEIGHLYLAKYQKPLQRTIQVNQSGVDQPAYAEDRGEKATRLFGDKFRRAAIQAHAALFS